MSVPTSSGQVAEEQTSSGEFEGEIREFVRKDVAPWRKRPERTEVSTETQTENVSMLVQRVAGASMSEIDNVVEELRGMREFLRSEGERVQREIAGYATVSQTAAASMKVIAESMAQWRSASGATLPPPFRG
jgi:hypothetical protein